MQWRVQLLWGILGLVTEDLESDTHFEEPTLSWRHGYTGTGRLHKRFGPSKGQMQEKLLWEGRLVWFDLLEDKREKVRWDKDIILQRKKLANLLEKFKSIHYLAYNAQAF